MQEQKMETYTAMNPNAGGYFLHALTAPGLGFPLESTPVREQADPQSANLQRQLWAAKLETQRTHQLLATSLDKLGVGLEIWDAQDRLVFCNKKNNRMHDDFYTADDVGQTFHSLMQANLKRSTWSEDYQRKKAWMEQRLASRGLAREPYLQGLQGGRWVNVYETRTLDGNLVIARVDVTDLVRKGNDLEALNRQLTQQSSTDALTGLANRRQFDEALQTEWLRAARNETSLCLLMIDIDHFKRFNDHYGHLAGDECLRRVGAALNRCVRRAGELVARFGGEEFVMLLPGADAAQARETAQRCLEQIEQEAVLHAASPTATQVTLSIGVAFAKPDARGSALKLINAADAAMYRAKTNGRNGCRVAEPSDWEIDADTPRTVPAALWER
jgi:diguanylate cyclase (GGDEF)-like protein